MAKGAADGGSGGDGGSGAKKVKTSDGGKPTLEKEGEESEQLLAAMAMHEEEEAACEEARAAAQLDRISRDEAVANKEMAEAVEAGVDGLIIVDLPPEEDGELCDPAIEAGLAFIRLVTPTTYGDRLRLVLQKAGGFVYYVAVAGITGTKSAAADTIRAAIARIRAETDLPVVTGFGIRTAEQAAEAAQLGDGAVVGSAVVDIIANGAETGETGAALAAKVGSFTGELANAIANASK